MQFLKNRVGQHKSAVNKNNVDHSALAEHAITNAHSIDWSNYEVMATENRLKPRQIKKSKKRLPQRLPKRQSH
jgi:hypothetical protein